MAISSHTTSVDFNPFLAKNIIEEAIEREKAHAKRVGSDADPDKHFNAERVAPLVRALALAGVGGTIGYNSLANAMSINGKPNSFDRFGGAVLGTAAGLGTSAAISLAAQIGAMITKRRKLKDQIKSDEKGVLAKYLIPGLAEYEGAKRYEAAKYDTYEKKGSAGGEVVSRETKGEDMNQIAYMVGFCKVAASHGINPGELAKYAADNSPAPAPAPATATTSTSAAPASSGTTTPPAGASGNWFAGMNLDSISNWWKGLSPQMRALLGAGGGFLGGALISKMFGGSGWLGGALGGLAGGAATVDWKALTSAFDKAKQKKQETADSAAK